MEDKEVILESLASFVCDDDDSNDRNFGLKFSSANASVSICHFDSFQSSCKLSSLSDSNWHCLHNILLQ